MNDWHIQSRAHGCQACDKAFQDQQVYHTLLFDEKQGFLRLDICQPCWEQQYSQGANDRKGFISYWHGTYESPPPAPPDAIQKENAETLLRKLIERNDPRYAAAGYILAVMLERKRLLKVKEQLVRDGQRIFIYEHPKSGDLFTIVDPNLQLNQLEQVQHDVAALLEEGLTGTPPSPSAPLGEGPPEAGADLPSAASPAGEPASAAGVIDEPMAR